MELGAGQWVLLEMPNKAERLVHLKADLVIELGRYGRVSPCQQLFGHQSGTYFQVHPGGRITAIEDPIKDIPGCFQEEEDEEDAAVEPETIKGIPTNETIFDSNTSQSLTTEQIEELKESCPTGATVVGELVKGNASWSQKNPWSQQKYLERKRSKFLKWILIRLPTARLLANHFLHRDPIKTQWMRIDSLSQLLALANLASDSHSLVWDETRGFLLGAMLARFEQGNAAFDVSGDSSTLVKQIIEDTRVVALHSGNQLQSPMLGYYNLGGGRAKCRSLLPLAISDLPPEPFQPEPFNIDELTLTDPDHLALHRRRYEVRQARRQAARSLCEGSLFSSLLLIYDPLGTTDSTWGSLLDAIDRLSSFLAPSGRLVVYSVYRDPLASLYNPLRRSGGWVDVSITESWLRPYQVEPGRTHPQMSCVAHGGVILTAIKVLIDS